MKLDATIAGLSGLADGDYDDVDEQAFYLIGDMSTLKASDDDVQIASSKRSNG